MKKIIALVIVIVNLLSLLNINVFAQDDKFNKFLPMYSCYCQGQLYTVPINENLCDIYCVNHGKVFTIDLNEYRANGWCTHDHLSADGSQCLDCKQVFVSVVSNNTSPGIIPSVQIDTCPHDETIEYFASGNIYPEGDKCCKEGYYITYCRNCNKELGQPIFKKEQVEHQFINGRCVNCGYYEQNQECRHLNTHDSFSGNASANENAFVRTGYFTQYCTDCGKELGTSYETREEPHVFNDQGICTLCGYQKQQAVQQVAWVYRTDGENLLLRTEPNRSSSSKVLKRIPEYSEITVLGGDAKSNYYTVEYAGIIGFAHSDFITFTKPEQKVSSSYVLPFNGTARVTVLEYYYGKASSGAHPTKGGGSIKGAVDFAAVTGSALATASGTVIDAKTGYNSGWGNYIIIKHNDGGTYSFYAHLAKISVSVNEKVNQSQAIGTIGSTGKSTGTHLHFELWDSKKNTIYTINALKDKYKNNLKFDSDIVSGGSNSNSIKNWIRENYTLAGNVYVPKSNNSSKSSQTNSTATSSANKTVSTQPSQNASSTQNKKIAFVNNNIELWKGVINSKYQAANAVIDVVNSVNIRLATEKVLGTSVSAAYMYNPGLLYNAFDEDAVIGLYSFAITNKYMQDGIASYNQFYTYLKSGINTEEQAKKVFDMYKTSIASFDAVIDGNKATVIEYSNGKTYTKNMLNAFFKSVASSAVTDISALNKLKKIANRALTASDIISAMIDSYEGTKAYKMTSANWDAIWDKL